MPQSAFSYGSMLAPVVMVAVVPFAAWAQPRSGPISLDQTIPLSDVSGRIDHLAVDMEHQRVFVAELGNGSVDAVDLTNGQTRRISGLSEPQGLGYLEDRDELVVASGGDGTLRFFDGATLQQLDVVELGDDADNVRVDGQSGEIVVGFGAGALAVIDAASRAVVRRVELPVHPEGFQIEGSSGRAFVNLPDNESIVVVDLGKQEIVATWKAAYGANFPMARSPEQQLVALAYRSPARLAVLDPSSGMSRQDAETCEDADDLFFDDERGRLYVICGEGVVQTFEQDDGGLVSTAKTETRSGARTGLFLPALDRLFVAAPAGRNGSDAALLVYRPKD